MMNKTAIMSVAEFRGDLADTLNRVAYGGERIAVERRGKIVVFLVPVEDLELIEAAEAVARAKQA